jgi:hypothetical protein
MTELVNNSKPLDRWYANLCFREKLILMERHNIDDWFELEYKEKLEIYKEEGGE